MLLERKSDMTDPHGCSEGRRFDRLEQSLEAIQKTLATLTDLLVSKATTDFRVKQLEESEKDFEQRIRTCEAKMNKNDWIERIAWVLLTSCLVAYFKLQV